MNTTNHKTRDHRFAYISTGDITTWARGTSKFLFPEPKKKRTAFVGVSDLDKCDIKPIAPALVQRRQVMIAPRDGDKSVAQEIESCERKANAIDNALAISDRMNKILGLIK